METEFKIVKDSQWNEYIVQTIEDGKVNPDKSYHTEDLQDARDTMTAMKKEIEVTQFQRIDQIGDGLNIPIRRIKT